MNILTFDIEEWYIDKMVWNRSDLNSQYDKFLGEVLDLLDERGLKGTFFCVGGMGSDFPYIVKNIDTRGHEIGCHSYSHVWLNKLSEKEALRDTKMAVDALEQCIGKKIKSYRAPAFSIGKKNKWAFDVLSDCGISRDASIFPAVRDLGGFAEFVHKSPTLVFYNQHQMKEFPVSTTKLFCKELAYSGGGYFRLFPLCFVRKEMAKHNYNMTYFHIGDFVLGSREIMSKDDYEMYFKEPGTLKNRYMRYIKSNLGKKKAYYKMIKLINTEDFINLEQADQMIDWQEAPRMNV